MPQDASYERLRHLQTISEAALAHLGFEELVRELLARLTAILGVDTAAVLLLDEERDELVARAAKGIEEEVDAQVRVPVGRGFAGRVAAERRPVVIPDIDSYEVYNPILREKGLRSLLGVPLLVAGEVTGVLHVGTLSPRDFSDDDSELLQLAADRIAVAIDHSRLYEKARGTAERLYRLEAVTDAALANLTLDGLLEVLLPRLRELVACDTAVVMLVDEEAGELVTLAADGVDPAVDQDARVPIGSGFSGRVAATGESLLFDDVQATEVATERIRAAGVRSMAGVPLVVAGHVTGVLGLGAWTPRAFSHDDLDLLRRAADRIALAIENARLYEAERAARALAEANAERIRRIESIGELALHHIVLDDEILERLLERVREVLDADTVALLLVDETQQTLVARAGTGVGHEVERGVEVPLGHGFAGRVAAAGEPVVVEDAASIEIVSPLLRESVVSLAGVPLTVEGRMLGVLHVGSRQPRAFGDEDIALLTLAGDRLAVALDHSRMYEREHHVAETLQRTLLPDRLPDVPGLEAAARYLPGEGEAVGGDWYDVIPLREGYVALAMGDVVSRGVRAAAVMGQLRNALRAYALESRRPAEVLERLNGISRGMEGRELATLVYMVLEPSSGTLAYASAGHPPPLVIDPDGEVSLLDEGRGPPLGAVADPVYEEEQAVLPRGGTVVLYTDGIVERRDMWIDEGIDRLVGYSRAAAGSDPDGLLEQVTGAAFGGVRPGDDVALLAVRTDPADKGTLTLNLPADPAVLSGMRQALRVWLAGLGAGSDFVYDVLVATTEAAANAVEHAYGPVDASFQVEARAQAGGQVAFTVRDQGQWRPPRGKNRGRGTMLMQEMMDHFEVQTDEMGTEVRMRKRLAGVLAA